LVPDSDVAPGLEVRNERASEFGVGLGVDQVQRKRHPGTGFLADLIPGAQLDTPGLHVATVELIADFRRAASGRDRALNQQVAVIDVLPTAQPDPSLWQSFYVGRTGRFQGEPLQGFIEWLSDRDIGDFEPVRDLPLTIS